MRIPELPTIASPQTPGPQAIRGTTVGIQTGLAAGGKSEFGDRVDADTLGRNGLFSTPSETVPDKDKVLSSSRALAEYLTKRWPQIDDGSTEIGIAMFEGSTRPRLNYYFAGSMAASLLAQARSITLMDQTRFPALCEKESFSIPKESSEIFARGARPIGDIDIVASEPYSKEQVGLGIGKRNIPLTEVPDGAKGCFGLHKTGVELDTVAISLPVPKTDGNALDSKGPSGFAKVTLDGRDFYIMAPDKMLGYKFLTLLQTYDKSPHQREKVTNDFNSLHGGLSQIFGEERLAQSTHEILASYQQRESQTTHGPLKELVKSLEAKENLPHEIRDFLKQIRKVDQEASRPLL